MFEPNSAIALLYTGIKLTSLATRAIEAGSSGDEVEAKKYLDEAREHYEMARSGWDRA